jgi:hypothetical protein
MGKLVINITTAAKKDASMSAEQILSELGLVKITKSTSRTSTGKRLNYVGYSRHTGNGVPAVDRVLSKLGIKAVYNEHQMLFVTLPNDITIHTYVPFKGGCQVEVGVPQENGNVETYHKSTVELLKLDKLDTGSPRYLTSRKRTDKGLLRLISSFVACTKEKKKKQDGGHTIVLKALKANGYTAGPSKPTNSSDNAIRTGYTNGTNTVIVTTTDYGDSAYIKFILFTPGSVKDLSK